MPESMRQALPPPAPAETSSSPSSHTAWRSNGEELSNALDARTARLAAAPWFAPSLPSSSTGCLDVRINPGKVLHLPCADPGSPTAYRAWTASRHQRCCAPDCQQPPACLTRYAAAVLLVLCSPGASLVGGFASRSMSGLPAH